MLQRQGGGDNIVVHISLCIVVCCHAGRHSVPCCPLLLQRHCSWSRKVRSSPTEALRNQDTTAVPIHALVVGTGCRDASLGERERKRERKTDDGVMYHEVHTKVLNLARTVEAVDDVMVVVSTM